MQPDFWFHNHGSIVLLVPRSEGAHDWADEHLPEDAPMWGYGYAIEPRYVQAILDGIADEGLTVDEA